MAHEDETLRSVTSDHLRILAHKLPELRKKSKLKSKRTDVSKVPLPNHSL